MPTRKQTIAAALRALVRDDVDPEDTLSWIRKATKRINEELRVGEMLKHKVLPLTSRVFQAPDDYLQHRDLRLGVNVSPEIAIGPSRGALIYTPPAQLATYSARRDLAGTLPGYFTTHGRNFEIVPWAIPSNSYQAGLWYFARFLPPTTDDGSNWLMDECEDLFLNAVLIFGHRHFYEDDRALLKDGLVQQEISRLNAKYEEARYGDGPLVMTPAPKLGGRFS